MYVIISYSLWVIDVKKNHIETEEHITYFYLELLVEFVKCVCVIYKAQKSTIKSVQYVESNGKNTVLLDQTERLLYREINLKLKLISKIINAVDKSAGTQLVKRGWAEDVERVEQN